MNGDEIRGMWMDEAQEFPETKDDETEVLTGQVPIPERAAPRTGRSASGGSLGGQRKNKPKVVEP